MYKEIGTKWSVIAKYFPGRTENSIKNRFYSTLRRIATKKRKELKKSSTSFNNTEIEYDINSNLQDLIQFIPTAITEKTVNYVMNKNIDPEPPKNHNIFNDNTREKLLIQDLKTNNKYQEFFNNTIVSESKNDNFSDKNINLNEQIIQNNKTNKLNEANFNNDDFFYDMYQKESLNNLENKIESFDFNTMTNLDNQIDCFVDNYFSNLQVGMFGLGGGVNCCENMKNIDLNQNNNNSNQPVNDLKESKDKTKVLLSLIEQINKLEKIVQDTKNELILKK
jgi:hypothetical protein